jgi:NAD(P)-dependent dehydrogenase (short-subunit alcohol dehydrogenase family)
MEDNMDLKLAGRKALISGSTKGIGLAIATSLAREGAHVVINGRAEFEREFFQTVRPSSLLKRFALPEEVASLVTYMCSPLSSATNGAALRVDGGVVRACF